MTDYKCSIIANPEGNAWKFARRVYEKLREKDGKFELNEVNVKKFNDREIKVKIKENVRRKNCFFIHDSSLEPAMWALQILFVNGTLRSSSAQEITNVLPYLKFSRQDRKDESRVSENAKKIAKMIEIDGDRVITLDVHNPAIQGFYDIPFDNLYSFPILIDYLKLNNPELLKNVAIMSPDAGGAERVQSFAKRLGIEEIVVGYKTRDASKPGEVKSLRISGNIEGKTILAVDDILDSGGTLLKCCEASREARASGFYAYCTHGLFTKGEKFLECLDGFFVTNTFYRKPESEKIRVINIDDLFADAIYRVNEGESLSELFD